MHSHIAFGIICFSQQHAFAFAVICCFCFSKLPQEFPFFIRMGKLSLLVWDCRVSGSCGNASFPFSRLLVCFFDKKTSSARPLFKACAEVATFLAQRPWVCTICGGHCFCTFLSCSARPARIIKTKMCQWSHWGDNFKPTLRENNATKR